MRKHALNGLFFIAIILTTVSYAQTPPCTTSEPRCYYDQTPYAGHGPASNLPTSLCSTCAGDNRRVVTIRIDSSWGNPTNGNVWNAAQCAAQLWNNARDEYGNSTAYYFVVDQAGQAGTADLTIASNSNMTGLANTNSGLNASSSTRQNTISLHPSNGTLGNGSFQADDLCGRIAHEMGHNIGARNQGTDCNTIMTGPDTSGNRAVNTVSGRDVQAVNRNFAGGQDCDASAHSGNECSPSGSSPGNGYVWDTETCQWVYQPCSQEAAEQCVNSLGMWHDDTCDCIYWPLNDPILVDVNGDGFSLTSAANGVRFDVNADSYVEKTAWTEGVSDDSWLALDRNGNGVIEDGTELFGDATAQPQSDHPNGFIALAEFDKTANGGNGDGHITAQDAVYVSLRLWRDTNHNGMSEPIELHSLGELGLISLNLDYKLSKKTDQYGNEFRYRGKVQDAHGAKLNRWAWDVFLQRTR